MIEEVDANESSQVAFMPDSVLLEQSLNGLGFKLTLDDFEIEDVIASLDFFIIGREVAVCVPWFALSQSLVIGASGCASQLFDPRLSVA